MMQQVGRSVKRLEGRAKVQGTANYIYNLSLHGMLYGKILRSSLPHARIRSIDTSAAQAAEGVYRVITGEDVRQLIPDPYYGPAFWDQPILALDKVHYQGEPVAVVLAKDPHHAEAALSLIEVDYEELPGVFSEVEAAQPDAPVVHDRLRPASTFADLKNLKERTGTNVGMEYHLRTGDVDQAFSQADYVFDDVYRSQQVTHVPMEPMVSIAEVDGDRLVVHTASQSPSFVRMELARLLGWPEHRVRVRTAHLGGGYGAKVYIKMEALAAACALIAKRPVKIALTMEEQFYTISRHATTVHIETGVSKDGRILGRRCTTWWNGGAFADIGPRVTQKSGFTAAGPYQIENVALDSYAVYTNRPPAGALRGFGIPQLVWAYESQTDEIAHRLGMDPMAFRKKNVLVEGKEHATGTVWKQAGTMEVLETLERTMEWDKPFDRGTGTVRRGRGVAVGVKASISPTTSMATVQIYGDGSCAVHTSTVDMGQGSDTAMAQITAEVLGLNAEDVRVVHPDTDATPYDMSTLGSRSTFHMGNAVRIAAAEVKEQLLDLAAHYLEANPKDLRLEGGKVKAPPGGQDLTLGDLMIRRFGMQSGNIIGRGAYTPNYHKPDPETGRSDNITPFWMVGASGVEISVDQETGRIVVERLVNVADVGKALNPAIVERQLSGAAMMQLGFTLFEEMTFDQGQLLNANLADYKWVGTRDVPFEITNRTIEVPNEEGPFGAKGVGESGTFGVSPAIANAIYDAVGVRIHDLPLTPEHVLRAIREQEGHPLEEE